MTPRPTPRATALASQPAAQQRPWWQPALLERYSIGVQVASFVVVLALIVLGLSYRDYVDSAQDLIRQAESERLTGAAHVARARIDAESRVLTASTHALAQHPAVRQALQAAGDTSALAATRLELDQAHARAGFSMLHLIDRTRVIVHRAAQPGLPAGKAAVWGISEALAGDTLLQTTKEASGGLVIRSMVPVRGRQDEVVGVVMAGTRFDDVFARRIGQDSGVDIAFATPTGVVARSSVRFGDAADGHKKLIEAALFERRPVLDFDLDRAALRQYVPVKLGDEAFVLIVQGDAAAAQARVVHAVHQALKTSVGLLALAMVASCLFALMLASRLRLVGARAQTLAHDITGVDHAAQRDPRTRALRSELAELEQVFDRTALAVARHHEELHEAKERAEHAANNDALTGLANRASLLRRLEFALANQPEADWALLFIDLDGFKQVNDSLGHDAGDALLRQVASRLHAQVGSRDLVARLGGDEFVIVAHAPSAEADIRAQAQGLARQVITALEQPFHLHADQSAQVSASVGIALHPVHGQEVSLLLKRADIALYAAKNGGRRTYCVYGSPGETEAGGLTLVA